MTCLRPCQKEHRMPDVVVLVLGLGFFGASVSYANACERLENDQDFRPFTRRPRLCWAAALPDVRPAAARAVLTASHTNPEQIRRHTHDRHWLASNYSILRDRDRAGQAARLVHDARLQRRAHIAFADPAASRGRALLDRWR